MREMILEVTTVAHGGSAMGRDQAGKPVFVPFAIPGETVRANLVTRKKNYAKAELVEVLKAAPSRVEPRCPHFTVCGGCHLQHMTYESQLKAKRDVVQDQMARIGGLKDATVRPTQASPLPWAYRIDVSLSPVPGGGLGFWSPRLRRVIPIETCHIIHPHLLALWQDIDLELPGLRKLTLRIGQDESLLVALEVDGVEPPGLMVDFPVSVAIVLPDKSAASLIGDIYLLQSVKHRVFRFSAGCFFQPTPTAAEMLIDSVLTYADLTGDETILDGYCGVGTLTAFLAESSTEVVGIDANPDAIADATVNLDDRDNVRLYQGRIEEVLPLLELDVDVVVANPPSSGLSPVLMQWISVKCPGRIVYVSSDVATAARDGRQLSRAGYRLVEIQPIDMAPQTYRIETVSLWSRH